MNIKVLITEMQSFLSRFFFLTCMLLSYAHATIPTGEQHWRVSSGTFIAMSGELTDNAASDAQKYTFYLKSAKENKLFQVPLVDGNDISRYTLTVSSIGDGEMFSEDAVVVTRGAEIFLLVAVKQGGDTLYAPAAITLRVYRLTDGEDGDWAYSFKLVRSKIYPESTHYSVERALKENQQGL